MTGSLKALPLHRTCSAPTLMADQWCVDYANSRTEQQTQEIKQSSEAEKCVKCRKSGSGKTRPLMQDANTGRYETGNNELDVYTCK